MTFSGQYVRWVMSVAGVLAVAAAVAPLASQDLEPRAYSNAPTSMNVALISYGYAWGGVEFDPTLPIEDVTASVHRFGAGYYRSFALFGKMASFSLAVPVVDAHLEGLVEGEFATGDFVGFGDPRARLSWLFIGGPALRPAEFAQRPRNPITVGATVATQIPIGEYDNTKLINLGANRWAVKTEVGFSVPLNRLSVEGAAGVWWIADNTDLQGMTKAQDPVATFQLHVSYTFRPGLWLGANGTFFAGGRSELDGVKRDDELRNSRLGTTLSIPLAPRHAIKLTYVNGIVTRIGASVQQVALSYQYRSF